MPISVWPSNAPSRAVAAGGWAAPAPERCDDEKENSEADDTPDGYHNSQVSDHTDENVQGARAANLLVGVYHLARPDRGTTANAEAAYFLGRAGNYLRSGYLPPVLDLEGAYGLTRSQLSAWVRSWLQIVETELGATGAKPIIYTTRSVLRDYLEADLVEYPLWIATDDGDETGIPSYLGTSWPNWKFKQYRFGENGGTLPGAFTGGVDLDSFNGNSSALNDLLIKPPRVITGIGGGGIRPPTGGQLQFEVHSDQPQVTIQTSEDLVTWTDLPPVTIVTGKGLFSDANAGAHTKRFYRPKPSRVTATATIK